MAEVPAPRPRRQLAATQASRGTVVSEAMACPTRPGENDQSRYFRRLGVIRMLDWLEAQPGVYLAGPVARRLPGRGGPGLARHR